MPHLQSNGIQLYYEERGTGTPVLLIMGITAPASVWELHAQAWQEQFRLILPDNRGVGRTDKPPGPYSSEMMAADFAGLLDALNLPSVHVVGCSMGSIIAQQLALLHSTRVRSLVLMCPWARCDAYATAIFDHMKTLKARLRPEEFMNYIQLLIFSKPTWDNPESYANLLEARRLAAENDQPQPLHALEAQAAACTSHDSLTQLPQIHCPTLVIGGDADIFTPPWMAREVAHGIPHSQLHLYPGSGHAFHWENIDDFNPRIRSWLASH